MIISLSISHTNTHDERRLHFLWQLCLSWDTHFLFLTILPLIFQAWFSWYFLAWIFFLPHLEKYNFNFCAILSIVSSPYYSSKSAALRNMQSQIFTHLLSGQSLRHSILLAWSWIKLCSVTNETYGSIQEIVSVPSVVITIRMYVLLSVWRDLNSYATLLSPTCPHNAVLQSDNAIILGTITVNNYADMITAVNTVNCSNYSWHNIIKQNWTESIQNMLDVCKQCSITSTSLNMQFKINYYGVLILKMCVGIGTEMCFLQRGKLNMHLSKI